MSEAIVGINPKILKWARERAKYSLEDVASKFKKDINIINGNLISVNLPDNCIFAIFVITFYVIGWGDASD
ncbi:hypothetical protein VB715_07700 [Crocosphaera sp. UHCC 0190]|uniref:hypothetical protein n=1 Tax=Crocosphaera sp. UHCC 0190 TaxID=3110246 RepID=UPI002B213ADA|nr:hypothetical protein [Crocosphaera sp. UHCC 0190]MEA5509645.1 hypothetical protein [Crocosphaera sp. UHCC 0190]